MLEKSSMALTETPRYFLLDLGGAITRMKEA